MAEPGDDGNGAGCPLPLSLYVHLPWCVRKCPYCDFNSHAVRGRLPENEYVQALLADLQREAVQAEGRPLASIFFGGGTPSLFSPGGIGTIIDAAHAGPGLADTCEITLEANPGTSEHRDFRDYAAAGVTRVSLGIQSFDDGQLQTLGRIHDGRTARNAIEKVALAGFVDFNLDLMYGLPGQTPGDAASDLAQAIEFAPPHLSHYQLTLEPNTLFHARPPVLPDEDTVAEMLDQSQLRLASAGYRQYEVSAYAMPGHACRHNVNYWRFGDYLGIGAGAHGKVTDPVSGAVTRRWKERHPATYLARAAQDGAIGGQQAITGDTLVFEYFLNVLRLESGFTDADFETRTGLPFAAASDRLADAVRGGLMTRTPDHVWRPTERGRAFLNDLQALFLPAETDGEKSDRVKRVADIHREA